MFRKYSKAIASAIGMVVATVIVVVTGGDPDTIGDLALMVVGVLAPIVAVIAAPKNES